MTVILTPCSILVANIYPIIETFKTFEQYIEAKKEFAKSNLNIGGFNVPINSLIKRATDDYDESKQEATVLIYHTTQSQKWLIYWVTNTSIDLVCSISLLKYIVPFYTFLRLILAMWLLTPFLKLEASLKDYNDVSDLNNFYESGCGLFYSRFLKPWLTGQIEFLSSSSFNVNKVYDQFASVLRMIISLMDRSPVSFVTQQPSVKPESVNAVNFDYISSLKNLTNFFGQESAPSQLALTENKVEEEYDVIDSPSNTESTGVSTKKGWFW